MKVLIFGASGFIGFASANAFVRAGHTVIGQTRSAATARILEQNEIYPLLCDLEKAEDVAHWHKAIDEADVVIDCKNYDPIFVV